MRKRITEIFPFLIPLRTWQRKKFFYLSMKLDANIYSSYKEKNYFENLIYKGSSKIINENSGYDIKYQYNKAYNLKLAAKSLDGIVIRKDEIFSLWNLIRRADSKEKYKDGLVFINGKIIPSYGGGLCQLSSFLYQAFLHSPLEIIERHPHAVENFAPHEGELCGADATIAEGFKDLKVKNNDDNAYMIKINFDDEFMHLELLSKLKINKTYRVYNNDISYIRENNKVYRICSVMRKETDNSTGEERIKELYKSKSEINYKTDKNTVIKER